MEQCSSLAPVAFDRSSRAAEYLRRLFDREPREEPQFDEPAQGLVQLRQTVQGVVQSDDVCRPLDSRHVDIVDVEGACASTPFAGCPPPRVVEHKLPHGLGGDSKEMMPILHGKAGSLRQLQIRFVDERGRLQRLIVSPPDLAVGHRAEVLVDERHQAMNGVPIAIAPGGEQLRDRGGVSCHGRHSRVILTRLP